MLFYLTNLISAIIGLSFRRNLKTSVHQVKNKNLFYTNSIKEQIRLLKKSITRIL